MIWTKPPFLDMFQPFIFRGVFDECVGSRPPKIWGASMGFLRRNRHLETTWGPWGRCVDFNRWKTRIFEVLLGGYKPNPFAIAITNVIHVYFTTMLGHGHWCFWLTCWMVEVYISTFLRENSCSKNRLYSTFLLARSKQVHSGKLT